MVNSAIIAVMDFQVAGHQSDYQINTELYSGPLDLLLQLIEKAELDITRLALAQVTDQYLEYLHNLQEQSAAEVSAFVVIAAKLVQIKSSALLPHPIIPGVQIEEDPGEALARQLIIYKKFKELSKFLIKREEEHLQTYLRLDTTPRAQIPTQVDLSELTLQDLVQAAHDILWGQVNKVPLSEVINLPRVTIRQKISTILDTLRKIGATSFSAVLEEHSTRVDIVVTFLALLELIKRHMVGANQSTLFGEINLQAEGDLTTLDDQELEFVD